MKSKIINIANIISFILLFITLLTLPASGNILDLSNELETLCSMYKHECQVEVIDNKYPQAYATRDNKIVFTTGIIQKLTENELKSVGYHEVGHIIFNHYKRSDKFFDSFDFQDNNKAIEMRRNHEIESDLFATYIEYKHGNIPYLATALFKLTSPDKLSIATDSHPATEDRIRYIYKFNNYLKGLKNEKNYYTSYSRFIYTEQYR